MATQPTTQEAVQPVPTGTSELPQPNDVGTSELPQPNESNVRTQSEESTVRNYPRRQRKKREWFEPGRN